MNTIGIVVVRLFAARAAATLTATMTRTFKRIRSSWNTRVYEQAHSGQASRRHGRAARTRPWNRGSLQVQEKLDFRGLYYRQIARSFPLENPGDMHAGQAIGIHDAVSTAHQTSVAVNSRPL